MSLYGPTVSIPVYAVFTAVGVALTGTRFWVRTRVSRIALGADDWFAVLAVVTFAACSAIQFYNAIKGQAGEAEKDPASLEHSVIVSRQIDWAMIVIEKVAFGAIKLSLLFFYRRIFGVWRSFRLINNALIAIVALWALSFIVADVLLCGTHPELIWGYDQTIALQRCGNRGAILLAFAVTSFATDLAVLSLPFFYINKLQMAKRKKWATALVFLLGFVSTGASILRLVFLSISYPVGRVNFAYKPPPQEQTPLVLQVFNPTFWAMVELALGVWAANLPALSPLLRSLHPYQMMTDLYSKITSSSRRPSAASNASDEKPLHSASTRRDTAPTVEYRGTFEQRNRDTIYDIRDW